MCIIKEEQRKETEGMYVTILGGSCLVSKGNTNSCGFVILTENKELIIVDGGHDMDEELVYSYITQYGNGIVDYWFVTHPHHDHVGALISLLNSDKNFEIQNLCYSVPELSYYERTDKRDFDTEKAFYDILDNNKIKTKIVCKAGQVINIDNVRCDIIRVANPELETTEGGNESSMVFKLTATDVDKSIIFLGDIGKKGSEELLERSELLKADSVQMAHHGQNGATKEVYDAIHPQICYFNCPGWLYNNDAGGGYNSGNWKTLEVREWVEGYNAEIVKAFVGDQTYRYTSEGIKKVE